MPKLPRKKVGLISCSGEELPEGTVTRRAVRRVLETLRPADTVTLCLPLFLAGGEGERSFARYYPTIAVDGCDKRCAARATEKYSAKPVASIVVSEMGQDTGGEGLGSARRLSEAGLALAEAVAQRIAEETDRVLKKKRPASGPPSAPSCRCGCGLEPPSGALTIADRSVRVTGLPLILAQFKGQGKAPDETTGRALLEVVKVYNDVPKALERAWQAALLREYERFLEEAR